MFLVSPSVAVVVASVVLWIVLRLRRRTTPLHLVRDAMGNESVYVRARVLDETTVFLVDTAYAGPPVLSLSYLALDVGGHDVERCVRAARDAPANVTPAAMHEALSRKILSHPSARSYTSGCTQRLMSIGTTAETQADMVLLPAMRFEGSHASSSRYTDADVFVTNPLHRNPHIMTNDYFLQHTPVVIALSSLDIEFELTAERAALVARTFEFVAPRLVGGAFVVPFDVGGAVLNIVVDTGASSPISLSRSAFERVKRRTPRTTHVTQMGVNGERVCSDVYESDVGIVGTSFRFQNVDVLVNSHNVSAADGYAGLGLLRAFDLYVDAADRLGFRRSGLEPSRVVAAEAGLCEAAR